LTHLFKLNGLAKLYVRTGEVMVFPTVVPDVDVVPHAARTVAVTTTSTPSACRRLANFDFIVFSSRVSDSEIANSLLL